MMTCPVLCWAQRLCVRGGGLDQCWIFGGCPIPWHSDMVDDEAIGGELSCHVAP